MKFEVDVSGEDLLEKDYTICIANEDGIIKGFKFSNELINILCSKYGQKMYKKYPKSQKGKATFKIRLYCIVVYYLVDSLKMKDISLTLCRDFHGREEGILDNLRFFIGKNLGINVEEKISFDKLSPNSNAHKYAYLMRKDNKNKINTYIKITLEDFERWLKK
jgi:hypothetical protein